VAPAGGWLRVHCQHRKHRGYAHAPAIGHFNVVDLVSLKAVFGAEQELKVPVLVGVSYCNGLLSFSESVVGGGIGGRLSLKR
jgi:fructose/tagatose bisphosphate aldolase